MRVGCMGCYHLVFEDRWFPRALERDRGLSSPLGLAVTRQSVPAAVPGIFSKKHFPGLGCS